MGAWGLKAFENDQALDFVEALRSADGPADVLRSAIDEADTSEYLEFDEAAEIVVAAEFIAAALGRRGTTVSEDDRPIAEAISFTRAKGLAASCKEALKRVAEKSELQELFAESDAKEVAQWRDYIASLLKKLDTKGLRAPKKKGKAKKKARRKKPKVGQVYALELVTGEYCFAKVVFLSSYIKGSILIRLFKGPRPSKEFIPSQSEAYAGSFWTYTACLRKWEVVGNAAVGDDELLLTKRKIGVGTFLLGDEKVEPENVKDFPIFISYFELSLLRVVYETLGLSYPEPE